MACLALFLTNCSILITVGKMAFPGDLIACIVDYGNFKNGRVPVVFTLNGEMIYEASVTYGKENCELYPIIRMSHGAEGMRVLAKVREFTDLFSGVCSFLTFVKKREEIKEEVV